MAKLQRYALGGAGLVLASLMLAPSAVSAQVAADSRWAAFLGCWQPLGTQPDADAISLLCFRSVGEGVELVDIVDGEAVAIERIVADDVSRPVDSDECEVWENVAFSDDGQRVFTQSAVMCDGDEPRRGSGIMSFTSPDHWVDVRALDVGGETVSWAQEYEVANMSRYETQGLEAFTPRVSMVTRSARELAAGFSDLADVTEALDAVQPEAVQNWVALRGQPFAVNGDDLVALADAGVPDGVIDVVVAVSNPGRFVVNTGGGVEESDARGDRGRYRGYRGYRAYRPVWGVAGYSPFSSFYRFNSPYGWYGAYGMPYGWGGTGSWGYRPVDVVIGDRSAA
jgi:hypothetical protein